MSVGANGCHACRAILCLTMSPGPRCLGTKGKAQFFWCMFEGEPKGLGPPRSLIGQRAAGQEMEILGHPVCRLRTTARDDRELVPCNRCSQALDVGATRAKHPNPVI